jgi:hypothetical protein
MTEERNDPPEKRPNNDRGDPPPYLFGLAILVLVVGGYFLCMKMAEMSRIQDCAMAGRHNCETVTDAAQGR